QQQGDDSGCHRHAGFPMAARGQAGQCVRLCPDYYGASAHHPSLHRDFIPGLIVRADSAWLGFCQQTASGRHGATFWLSVHPAKISLDSIERGRCETGHRNDTRAAL
ncbi:MAG: hypothetical protein Q8L92_10090, partial [Rubrivivax sp.]|nr:hypothetical protein [Rubrivivax sp.]